MGYPSNRSVTNSFDTAGRLNSLSGTLGDDASRTYSTNILYTANGSLAMEQLGTSNAIYNKLFYNSRQQLTDILASTSNDNTNWNRGKISNQYSLQCSGASCNATDNNGSLRKQTVSSR